MYLKYTLYRLASCNFSSAVGGIALQYVVLIKDPMQNPQPFLSENMLENLENRISTLRDLIQDRRLSLSSCLSPLRPGDLYFNGRTASLVEGRYLLF